MLALKNGKIISFDPPGVTDNSLILIDQGGITAVGPETSLPAGCEVLDCAGKYIAPGLVCSHNHFYSALSRGIIAKIKPSTDFVSQLHNLWWRLDRAIDEDILRSSALIGALEALRCGTTSVVDHHASPSFITGSLTVIKEAFEQAGLRGILCYETTDRNGPKGMWEGVKENTEFAKSVQALAPEKRLVEAAIGGHAPNTLGDEALSLLAGAVKETGRGFHIHIGEDRFDSSFSHALYQKDILERLSCFGLVNDKALFIHGVHLTEADITAINGAEAFLVHNSRSNMNNNVGYNHQLPALKNSALGTDGIGSDMWEEFKFAFFNHRNSGGSFWPGDFLKILHRGNKILSRYFSGSFGSVNPGNAADLMILDYPSPTPLTGDNLAGHMAFGMSASSVETVIVKGRVVYRDRSFPFDTAPIYLEAEKQAARLWKRMDELGD